MVCCFLCLQFLSLTSALPQQNDADSSNNILSQKSPPLLHDQTVSYFGSVTFDGETQLDIAEIRVCVEHIRSNIRKSRVELDKSNGDEYKNIGVCARLWQS